MEEESFVPASPPKSSEQHQQHTLAESETETGEQKTLPELEINTALPDLRKVIASVNLLQVKMARDTVPVSPGQDLGGGDGTPVPTPIVSSAMAALMRSTDAGIKDLVSTSQEQQSQTEQLSDSGDPLDENNDPKVPEESEHQAQEKGAIEGNQSEEEVEQLSRPSTPNFFNEPLNSPSVFTLQSSGSKKNIDPLPKIKWIDESKQPKRPMWEPAIAVPQVRAPVKRAQILGTLQEGERVDAEVSDAEDMEALEEHIKSGRDDEKARERRESRMLQDRKILTWEAYARNHPTDDCVKLAQEALQQHRIDGTRFTAHLVSKEGELRSTTKERDHWRDLAQGVYGKGAVTEDKYNALVRKFDDDMYELRNARKLKTKYSEAIIESLRDTVRQSEADCKEAIKRSEEFERKAEAFESEGKRKKARLNDANNETARSDSEVTELKKKIEEQKLKIKYLTKDNKAFERALDPDNKEIDVLKKWEAAKITILELERKIRDLEKQNHKQVSQLLGRDADILRLKKRLEDEKDSLQKSLDKCLEDRRQLQQKDTDDDDKNKEFKNLKIENTGLREENNELQQRIDRNSSMSRDSQAGERNAAIFETGSMNDYHKDQSYRIQSQEVEIERLKPNSVDTKVRVNVYENQLGDGAPNDQRLKEIIDSQQVKLEARTQEIANLKAELLGQRNQWADLKDMIEGAVGACEETNPLPGIPPSSRPFPSPLFSPNSLLVPSTTINTGRNVQRPTQRTPLAHRFAQNNDGPEKPTLSSLKFLHITLRVSLQQTMKNRAIRGFQDGDIEEANTIAEQFIHDASASRIDQRIAMSFYYMGIVSFYRDDLAAARDAFEKAEERDTLSTSEHEDVLRWMKRCDAVGVGRSPATYGGSAVLGYRANSPQSTPVKKRRMGKSQKKDRVGKGQSRNAYSDDSNEDNLRNKADEYARSTRTGWDMFGVLGPGQSTGVREGQNSLGLSGSRPMKTTKTPPQTPEQRAEHSSDGSSFKSLVNSIIFWTSSVTAAITSPPPSKLAKPPMPIQPVARNEPAQTSTGSPVRRRRPRATPISPTHLSEKSQQQSTSDTAPATLGGSSAFGGVFNKLVQHFPFARTGGAAQQPAPQTSATSTETPVEEPIVLPKTQRGLNWTTEDGDIGKVTPRNLIPIFDTLDLLLQGGPVPIAQPPPAGRENTLLAPKWCPTPVTGPVTPFPGASADVTPILDKINGHGSAGGSALPPDAEDVFGKNRGDTDLDALLETLTHGGDEEVMKVVRNVEVDEAVGQSPDLAQRLSKWSSAD